MTQPLTKQASVNTRLACLSTSPLKLGTVAVSILLLACSEPESINDFITRSQASVSPNTEAPSAMSLANAPLMPADIERPQAPLTAEHTLLLDSLLSRDPFAWRTMPATRPEPELADTDSASSPFNNAKTASVACSITALPELVLKATFIEPASGHSPSSALIQVAGGDLQAVSLGQPLLNTVSELVIEESVGARANKEGRLSQPLAQELGRVVAISAQSVTLQHHTGMAAPNPECQPSTLLSVLNLYD